MPATADVLGAPLTRREEQVMRLMTDGPRSNRQVAELLWVTEQTVKYHLANAYRKLGVQNRYEAMDAFPAYEPSTPPDFQDVAVALNRARASLETALRLARQRPALERSPSPNLTATG